MTEDLFSAPSEEGSGNSGKTKRPHRPWLKAPEPDFDLHSLAFCAVLSVENHGGVDDNIYTVIEKLPKSEPFLATLTRRISMECKLKPGYRMDRKDGVIEISGGDKRIVLREFFDQEGLKYIG